MLTGYEAVLRDYGDALRFNNFSPYTVDHYTRTVQAFFGWLLAEKEITRVGDIRREDVRDFEARVHGQTRLRDGSALSMETKIKKILALRNFFRFLFKRGLVHVDLGADIEVPRKNSDRLRETLKEKEVRVFLEGIQGRTPHELRDRAMFELFYSSGIRNTELRTLNVGDVDLKDRQLTVREAKGYFGPRQRIVPMGSVALGFLEEYLLNVRPKFLKNPAEKTLFISSIGRPLSIEIPGQLARYYAKKIGIDKRVTPHILRHSFAAHLLKRGADIRHVQAMLGHACLDSTRIYTKLDVADLKRIHTRCHPREKMNS